MILFFSEYLGGNSRYPLPLNICPCDPQDRTVFTTHTVIVEARKCNEIISCGDRSDPVPSLLGGGPPATVLEAP